ncbi:hypothetical protein Y032_0389g512 [Ancylostoma ceylanicum]|nr:hypothetical protein Y032_0389g512 [Ancylostoma ceylanicum]
MQKNFIFDFFQATTYLERSSIFLIHFLLGCACFSLFVLYYGSSCIDNVLAVCLETLWKIIQNCANPRTYSSVLFVNFLNGRSVLR